ncbi:MAG: ribbon-helix-helix protein, CopG family [Pseudomonadota bacterium]
MLSIRLPDVMERRLASLAAKTGRTRTALAREGILQYINDLEDHDLAEARARKNRMTVLLQDVEKALKLPS